MSAASHSSTHSDSHDHDEGHDELHATLGGYLVGFGLSVLLTAIPFWLVMSGVIANKQITMAIITAFAVIQIVVHMIFFLHLNAKIEQGWTLLSTVFTIILVVITLSGSLWVMYHLDTNMHPVHDMSQLP
ncbi:MAG: cytochrome o ubiquinol oxidase subunit IV [Steroidobacteraceae bacterium]